MDDQVEQLLRVTIMNQVEIMRALEELLAPPPTTLEGLDQRRQLRSDIGEAIDVTLDIMKAMKNEG